MIGWGNLLLVGWRLISGNLAGGIGEISERLLDRVAALQEAKTEIEKAEIEKEIIQLKALQDIQKPQASRWWSPMQVGQYLIVIPYGLWWASVFLVSIINANVGFTVEIQDVPPRFHEIASWLIPAIVVGTIFESRRK